MLYTGSFGLFLIIFYFYRGYYDDRTMAYGLPPQDHGEIQNLCFVHVFYARLTDVEPSYNFAAYRDNYDRGPARYTPLNGSQAG